MEKNEELEKYTEELKKAKEPKFIEKLELGEGEVYVGNLSQEDKMQLLTRHLNNLSNIQVNVMNMLANVAVCLQELCKKQGIDIGSILDNIKE